MNADELNKIHQRAGEYEEYQQIRAFVLRSLPKEKQKLLRKNDREYLQEKKPSAGLEKKVFSEYKQWAQQFEPAKPSLIKQFFDRLFTEWGTEPSMVADSLLASKRAETSKLANNKTGSSIFVKSGLVAAGVLLGIMIFPMMNVEIEKEQMQVTKEYVMTDNPELNNLLTQAKDIQASNDSREFTNWALQLKKVLGASEKKMTLEKMQASAHQGDPVAQNALALRLISGDGVNIDFLQAIEWFRKAAEQGYSPAQVNLALCYWVGKGVSIDYDKALLWLRKAAQTGNQNAKNMLLIFENRVKN